MKKPVDTALIVSSRDGAARRNPEIEGVSSLTAWKYKGALKMMVNVPTCEKKFENTRFALGEADSKGRGMMGRFALFSTKTRATAKIPLKMSDAMMSGCFHGKMLPPRFSPRIKQAVADVRRTEPPRSKSRRISCHSSSEFFARLGPSSFGTVKMPQTKMNAMIGIWMPNVHLQPSVSHR